MENPFFKQEAKMIVDMLFETKCFKEDITRDHMNETEAFISEMMDTRYRTHLKLKNLTEKINSQK